MESKKVFITTFNGALIGKYMKKIAKAVLYLCVAYILLTVILRYGFYGSYTFYPAMYGDEQVWRKVSVSPFSEFAQSHDNKSPIFLLINNLLQIQNTLLFTRLLNYLIYVFITVFIYNKTKRIESIFILLFIIFNYPPILFDVAFETLFIVLAISYENRSGIFVGLAGIFRPYSFIYAAVLEKKQRMTPFYFGAALAIVMLITGGFFAYFDETSRYAVDVGGALAWYYQNPTTVYFYVILLASLMYLSYDKNKYYVWGLVSCLPLILRTYEHYFIPPVIIFFYLYLLRQNPTEYISKYKPERTPEKEN